jgi:hypothetical protein
MQERGRYGGLEEFGNVGGKKEEVKRSDRGSSTAVRPDRAGLTSIWRSAIAPATLERAFHPKFRIF